MTNNRSHPALRSARMRARTRRPRVGTIAHRDAPAAGAVGSGFGPAAIFGAVLLEDKVVTLSHDQLVVTSLPALEILQEHTWPR